MRSYIVVVASIGTQNSAQVRLAQDDEMIHTLAPDRSDQPFGKAILPRRDRCRRLVPDAHGAQSASDGGAIDPIPIPDEVLRGIIPWKCLRYLTRNPFRRRMACHVDPDEVSPIQPHNDEARGQDGQDGQDEAEQSEHGPHTLGDSFGQSMRIRFSVHTALVPIPKRSTSPRATSTLQWWIV